MSKENKDIKLTDKTPLYRIMPLERLLQMLHDGENVLVKPSAWEDPYEKMYKRLYKDGELCIGSYSCMLRVPVNKGWYAQCWSLCEESDGLWRAFTGGKQSRSVKLCTTVGQLTESYKKEKGIKFFIDNVSYPMAEEEKYKAAMKRTFDYYSKLGYDKEISYVLSFLLTKREAFKYEEEVRLIAYKKDYNEAILPYTIEDFNTLIKRIELDPWTPEECVKGIGAAITNQEWNTGNMWEVDIKKSNLYELKYNLNLQWNLSELQSS